MSTPNVNLTKGRFIKARSTLTQSADIMIIWIIYKIAKLKDAYIELITLDHFGKTLEELVLHFNIKLVNRRENVDQNSVKPRRMIDEK